MKSGYVYVKKWREKNPDKVREYNRAYNQKHKEEISQKRRLRYLKSKQNERGTDADTLREVPEGAEARG